VIDPLELGPVRLVGVGFAGLSTVRQGSLFPELDLDVPGYQESKITEAGADDGLSAPTPAPARAIDTRWHPGLDVTHPDFGHGWVQGAGHGVVTVRFETRTTGPGKARTFKEDDAQLEQADVEGSLE
jgi:DNA polymerase-4